MRLEELLVPLEEMARAQLPAFTVPYPRVHRAHQYQRPQS